MRNVTFENGLFILSVKERTSIRARDSDMV